MIKQLGLDWTFFIEFLLLSVLCFTIGRFYLVPYLEIIKKRKIKTIGAQEEASRLLREAEARFSEYRFKLKDEQIKTQIEHEKALMEIRKTEAKLLSQARDEVRQINAKISNEIKENELHYQQKIESFLPDLSNQLVSQLLAKRK